MSDAQARWEDRGVRLAGFLIDFDRVFARMK
jgi:hypothetical protein